MMSYNINQAILYLFLLVLLLHNILRMCLYLLSQIPKNSPYLLILFYSMIQGMSLLFALMQSKTAKRKFLLK